MTNLKQSIPDLVTLEKRLGEILDVSLSEIIASTEVRRFSVIKSRQRLIYGSSAFVVLIIIHALFQKELSAAILNIIIVCGIALGVVTVIYALRWYREQKSLAQELNLALVPTVITSFNRQVLYTQDKVHQKETEAMLQESDLISNFDNVTVDDMYSFYEPYSLSVREISVSRETGSRKKSRNIVVFHGVLVQVELNKTLSGITFISTEGDKFGFGHQSFWTGIIDTRGVEETKLEWNEFERDLHVASNNGTEARYILTPNFMVDLHTWWLEHKQNIRIVFKQNKMFMLLPDTGIRISSCTTSTDPLVIKQYALSVLKPLWRTLTLVEDVRF